MTDKNSAADKSIVNELNFGAKTSKRVGWEAWEFSVEAPHLVRVTNASYGFEKADHSYLVGVEDRNGLLVPSECECPADKYNEEYDCKHKVALATVGGPVILQAAVDCPTPRWTVGKPPGRRWKIDSALMGDLQQREQATIPSPSMRRNPRSATVRNYPTTSLAGRA